MRSQDPRKLVIQAIFLVLGLVYLSRLFYMQIIDEVSTNEIRKKKIAAPRGLIYDRNGVLLVANQPVYDVWVKPSKVIDLDTFKLSKLLGLDSVDFRARWKNVSAKRKWENKLFVSQISQQRYTRLQEMIDDFPGFTMEQGKDRVYPEHGAAHILGYISKTIPSDLQDSYYSGLDYIGRTGLEKSYEKKLRGLKGTHFFLRDVKGKNLGTWEDGLHDTLAIPGEDLTTTIDIKLQKYGEALMQNKLGSIVALEPSTGEILALVSSPSFDPGMMVGRVRSENYKILEEDTLKPLYNRALMARYPPGSTFKTIMSLIALEEGVVGEYEHVKCLKDHKIEGMVTCHDHKKNKGIREAIKYSCNTYYSVMLKRIMGQAKFGGEASKAYDHWRNMVTSFGLNQKLNREGFGEKSGWVPKHDIYDKLYGKKHWKAPTIISLSVGQGELLLTPLQIANVYAVVANRGFYISPHLVKRVGSDSLIDSTFYQKHFVPISKRHFDPVLDGLEAVVEDGTAKYSSIPGVKMLGKTGTAENPHGEDHSIFAALSPRKDPKIVICVFVENSGYGSTWAAPIASLMIEKYLKGFIEKPSRKRLEKKMLEGKLLY